MCLDHMFCVGSIEHTNKLTRNINRAFLNNAQRQLASLCSIPLAYESQAANGGQPLSVGLGQHHHWPYLHPVMKEATLPDTRHP